MSNPLDPVQDQHSVSPDLDPNCLQRLSADDKSHCQQEKSCIFRRAKARCVYHGSSPDEQFDHGLHSSLVSQWIVQN